MLGEGETISSKSTAQGKMTTHPRIFGQHNLILNDLKRTQRWVGIEEAWIWKELGKGRWILSKYVVYNTQRTNRANETFKSTGFELQGPQLPGVL